MFYLDLFEALEHGNVRYLLVGGLAINIHGVERATMDIDLMLALDPENLSRFLATAEALALTPVLPVGLADLADDRIRKDWVDHRNMIAFGLRASDPTAPVLDILIKPSISFDEAYGRRICKDLGNCRISLASLDDLISMKSMSARAHDLSDVAALRRLRELGLG